MERSSVVRFAATLVLAAVAAAPVVAASLPAVEAEHAMVVADQRLAAEAGLAILRQGGNAVDAAVATGYALAVTHPCCGNLGGGGFMLIRFANGEETFIDFRETAPAAASETMYQDAQGNPIRNASLRGWRAAGVPGTVAGFETALAAYGRLSRRQVMAPAIHLAWDGFLLTRGDTDILDFGGSVFAGDETARRIFRRPDGTPLLPGDRLVQPDLGRTLATIARSGPNAFYRGPIAQQLVRASAAGGGILTAADLAGYSAIERTPLHCDYRGYQVTSAPPPSGGGTTLCEILNILEGYDLHESGFASARSVHVMAEAMRHAFLDRNTSLGDPAFIANPLDRLLSKDYAAAIRQGIAADRATPSEAVQPGVDPHEKPETTHYSVVDSEGNAVAVTFTLNGLFGAGVMAPGTGFFLNDEMDDFSIRPGVPNLFSLVQGRANVIAPGKRPLSSMAPTIVVKDGHLFLVVGSPGGSRIISVVLEVLTNIIDFAMKPQEAVDAPRFHHQWLPDRLFAEPFALSPDTAALLSGMGYELATQTSWGAAGLIERAPDQAGAGGPATSGNDAARSGALRPGRLYGACDSRRPAGAAVGY